jgi:hypothetical protein
MLRIVNFVLFIKQKVFSKPKCYNWNSTIVYNK